MYNLRYLQILKKEGEEMREYLFRMTIEPRGKGYPRKIEQKFSISHDYDEKEADALARSQACKIWEKKRKGLRLKEGIMPETESELFKKIPFP